MRKHKSDRVMGMLTLMLLLGMGLIVIYAIGPMRANVMNSAYGTSYSENHFLFTTNYGGGGNGGGDSGFYDAV